MSEASETSTAQESKKDKKGGRKNSDNEASASATRSMKRAQAAQQAKEKEDDGDKFNKLCRVMMEGFSGIQNSMQNLGGDISTNILQNLAPQSNDDEDMVDDDNIFTQLQSDYVQEDKTDVNIHDDVATTINKMLQSPANDEAIKTRVERHVRPENCEFMQVPKLNPEVWNGLPGIVRGDDASLQGIEENVIRSTIPIAKVINTLFDIHNNDRDANELDLASLIKDLSDSVAFSGDAHFDILKMRKAKIKPSLPKDMQKLCSTNVDSSATLLFGENLGQTLKTIQDANKLSMDIRPTFSTRFRGRSSSRFRGRWTRPHFKSKYNVSNTTRASYQNASNTTRGPYQSSRGGRSNFRRSNWRRPSTRL